MKKYRITALFLALFLLTTSMCVFAEPQTDMRVTISDVIEIEEGILFTVNIRLEKPSEPYASMDFYLVTSDAEQLFIKQKPETDKKNNLAVEFSSDFGGAYHEGRVDEKTGATRYLFGIFSFKSGNPIFEAVDVCSVWMLYKGENPQTLNIENMKFVFQNDAGDIVSAQNVREIPVFSIDGAQLRNIAANTEHESEVILDDIMPPTHSVIPQTEENTTNPIKIEYIFLTIGLIGIIVFLIIKLKYKKRELLRILVKQEINQTENRQKNDDKE